MKSKICTFAGHAKICNTEKIKLKLKNKIINLIENHNVTIFYNGGKGEFDWLCANCIQEIKKDYPFIKSYLVLPYMPKGKNEHSAELYKNFDGTLYPDIENIPPKFAIIKRNKWMIDKSDFLIVYISHNWGGAYKTFAYARKKKSMEIVNLCLLNT